jgi:lipopolysaccharide transport system ATP-binding protein
MQEPLLEVTGISKKYARSMRRSLDYGVRDVLSEMLNRKRAHDLRTDEFWALRDVSFTLRRGECLAILGANGAGKSTLLKLLSGMLLPDGGSIVKRGRMEKMIELSAGFSPSLSGRENVMLKARLLGLSGAELSRRLEDLVAFAELEEFIDTPVQFYSSGMRARLGFALSVAMEPDILLIDEVLAVGDLAFRMKCYERVDDMRARSAVVLVTHAMNHVSRMATASLVLHKGKVVQLGSPQQGIAKYQELAGFGKPAKEQSFNPDVVSFCATHAGVEILDQGVVQFGAAVSLQGRHESTERVHISVVLQDSGGNAIVEWDSRRSGFAVEPRQAFRADLGSFAFCPGYYRLYVVGISSLGKQIFMSRVLQLKVEGDYFNAIRVQPITRWEAVVDQSKGREVAYDNSGANVREFP